jgi:hypothetical protein
MHYNYDYFTNYAPEDNADGFVDEFIERLRAVDYDIRDNTTSTHDETRARARSKRSVYCVLIGRLRQENQPPHSFAVRNSVPGRGPRTASAYSSICSGVSKYFSKTKRSSYSHLSVVYSRQICGRFS